VDDVAADQQGDAETALFDGDALQLVDDAGVDLVQHPSDTTRAQRVGQVVVDVAVAGVGQAQLADLLFELIRDSSASTRWPTPSIRALVRRGCCSRTTRWVRPAIVRRINASGAVPLDAGGNARMRRAGWITVTRVARRNYSQGLTALSI